MTGFSLYLFFVLCGCDDENNFECSTSPNQYMLFLDKSGSFQKVMSSSDSAIWSRTSAFLNRELGNGCKITGYYIHDATLGGTPFLEQEIDVKCPETGPNVGVMDSADNIEAYNNKIDSEKENALNTLRRGFLTINDENTFAGTDIWSTFELMSRFFKDSSAESKKVVFYVSDMKESTKNPNGRNFDRKLPKDQHEAQKWALVDADKIRKAYKINQVALQGVSVYLLFPEAQLTATNRAQMRYYWESLFGALGITEVEESLPKS